MESEINLLLSKTQCGDIWRSRLSQCNINTTKITTSTTFAEETSSPIKADLPPYQQVNMVPNRDVNGHQGEAFVSLVNEAYNKIIKWRKNLFKLPSGKAAKGYITELTKWIDHYNKGTDLHAIALKVFHILPALLLQKPSKNSKAKEHLQKL